MIHHPNYIENVVCLVNEKKQNKTKTLISEWAEYYAAYLLFCTTRGSLTKTGRGVPFCLLRGSIILRVNKYTWSRCCSRGHRVRLHWIGTIFHQITPVRIPAVGPDQKHSSLAAEIIFSLTVLLSCYLFSFCFSHVMQQHKSVQKFNQTILWQWKI